MKLVLQNILKILAVRVIKKYQPKVVGVTGSVGKTSAKTAIAAVLATQFRVGQNIKNYNNEIGLPLTILQQTSAGRSLGGWLKIFSRIFKLLTKYDDNYPEILVLEMGVDRPGDMDYLLSIVKPHISVVTAIGLAHLEFFGSQDNIQKEKGKITSNLLASDWAILNYDDERARSLESATQARVITYGLGEGALVRGQDIRKSFADNGSSEIIAGSSFKLRYNGSAIPVLLPRAISQPAVLAALAAAAVGFAFELNGIDVANGLKNFLPPPGRLNLLPGIKNTMIIDDTYNASPQSCVAALAVLADLPLATGAQKYAVLGDMLELGPASQSEHQALGKLAAKSGVDCLLAVGARCRDLAVAAAKAGLDETQINHFDNWPEALAMLKKKIKANDIILVKGSQGMRLEQVVKGIMAEPKKAEKLLVRQGPEWR